MAALKLLVASVAAAVSGSLLVAQAEVPIRVKNCTTNAIHFWTFNGNDSLEDIDYDHGTFSPMAAGEDDAKARKIACHFGEFCKLRLEPSSFDAQPGHNIIKVRAHHHMRIVRIDTGIKKYKDVWGTTTELSYPITVYTTSEHEEHCQDPANDSKKIG